MEGGYSAYRRIDDDLLQDLAFYELMDPVASQPASSKEHTTSHNTE